MAGTEALLFDKEVITVAAPSRSKHTHDDCPFSGLGLIDPSGRPLQSRPVDSDMERRIGFLEGAMKTMADKISDVGNNVGQLSTELNRVVTSLGQEIGELREIVGQKIDTVTTRMAAAMEHVSQETRQSAKPNYIAIISIVGMAGALGAYILNGHNADILATKSDVKQVQSDFAKAEFQRGQADERASETSKALATFVAHYELKHKDLDERLRVETREAQIAVDAKLQSAVGGVQKQLDTETSKLTDFIADIRKWRIEDVEKQSYFRGKVDAINDAAGRHATREPPKDK